MEDARAWWRTIMESIDESKGCVADSAVIITGGHPSRGATDVPLVNPWHSHYFNSTEANALFDALRAATLSGRDTKMRFVYPEDKYADNGVPCISVTDRDSVYSPFTLVTHGDEYLCRTYFQPSSVHHHRGASTGVDGVTVQGDDVSVCVQQLASLHTSACTIQPSDGVHAGMDEARISVVRMKQIDGIVDDASTNDSVVQPYVFTQDHPVLGRVNYIIAAFWEAVNPCGTSERTDISSTMPPGDVYAKEPVYRVFIELEDIAHIRARAIDNFSEVFSVVCDIMGWPKSHASHTVTVSVESTWMQRERPPFAKGRALTDASHHPSFKVFGGRDVFRSRLDDGVVVKLVDKGRASLESRVLLGHATEKHIVDAMNEAVQTLPGVGVDGASMRFLLSRMPYVPRMYMKAIDTTPRSTMKKTQGRRTKVSDG